MALGQETNIPNNIDNKQALLSPDKSGVDHGQDLEKGQDLAPPETKVNQHTFPDKFKAVDQDFKLDPNLKSTLEQNPSLTDSKGVVSAEAVNEQRLSLLRHFLNGGAQDVIHGSVEENAAKLQDLASGIDSKETP